MSFKEQYYCSLMSGHLFFHGKYHLTPPARTELVGHQPNKAASLFITFPSLLNLAGWQGQCGKVIKVSDTYP